MTTEARTISVQTRIPQLAGSASASASALYLYIYTLGKGDTVPPRPGSVTGANRKKEAFSVTTSAFPSVRPFAGSKSIYLVKTDQFI